MFEKKRKCHGLIAINCVCVFLQYSTFEKEEEEE